MAPVGLAFKKNKGELIVVHLCLGCGKVSTNRIAGDDNTYVITCLLNKSNYVDSKMNSRLVSQGVHLLAKNNKKEVLIALYGYNYKKYMK